MGDVDNMSDSDIRTKLIEFGFPVMPITGTTRKLMVKKLKLLLETRNKGGGDRRSLGRYSSEEESDTDSKAARNKDKNRRATMAAPASNRSITRRSTQENDVDGTKHTSPSIIHTTTKRTTTAKITKSVQDEFDTGSDTEPELIEVEDSPMSNNYSNKLKNESPSRYGLQEPTSYSTPKTDMTSMITTTYSSNLSNKVSTPPRFSTFASSSTANNDTALDRLNQIRSRLSLGSPGYERPSTYASPTSTESKAEGETPFLSNFTRRLSQLSSTSPIHEYGFKNDIIKEHDTNGATDYSRSYVMGRSKYRDVNRDYYTRHNSNIVKNNLISFAVLGVALLFFVIVGAMYWGMRSGDSALETSGYSIPFCTSSLKHGINCINESELESTLAFMKAIKPELSKRAFNYACTNTVIKPYMTEPDVINYYLKLSGEGLHVVQQRLQLLEILIFHNPEWDISIAQIDGNSEISQKNVLNDMNEVIALRPSKTIALAVLHPDISWKCTISNKIFSIFNTLLILAAAFGALYITNLGFKYYKHQTQRQKDEVIHMVERIIDILQTSTSEELDNFLVINHVRDMILPINDRKRMEKAWDQAVKFINDNESRVRTEVQVVKGEPFEVWRWISSPSLNTSSSPRSKTWQGQAFETQVGSVNSLQCSPTPCLKIRGMLDDPEQNVHTVREAVLSKCAHQCRILHCAVDSNSKCVYIKCSDQDEAAVAYRNLHGWWYAGQLITVKYLRLERYMQRFPDSPVTGTFLKSVSPATDWSN